MSKYCLLTNDVESTSIWFNDLRDDTAKKVMNEGMPKLLDLYLKYNIKTTFFFTGYIARLFPEIVKMVLPYGHEVGSHGLSHKKEHGFDALSLEEQKYHLRESKKILENISGKEVVSFRAPALRVNNFTAIALSETGYKYDCSVASQRFDFFMSFGGLKKIKWLFAPRLPYRTRPDNLLKKGNGDILEIPLSAFLVPFVGTTMRIFPLITRIQRSLLNIENNINKKPIVFDIHPNEFIDESDLPRKINKRSKSFLMYIAQDLIRSKLKTINLGKSGLDIYEGQLIYLKKKKNISF